MTITKWVLQDFRGLGINVYCKDGITQVLPVWKNVLTLTEVTLL
jgi:hypothetical protein